MEVCLTCVKHQRAGLNGSSKFIARAVMDYRPPLKVRGIGEMKCPNSMSVFVSSRARSSSNMQGKSQLIIGLVGLDDSGVADFKGLLQLAGNIKSRISAVSNIPIVFTDKFAGHISKIKSIVDFQPTQKLFPIRDIEDSLGGKDFVNKDLNKNNLFESVNEGIFTGNYVENQNFSRLISDDKNSYIQPSSLLTEGNFSFKCEVTPPVDAQDSFIFIRASAPTRTFSADIPPKYKLSNIQLLDPSGNIIVKYKDLTFRGDSNYGANLTNFVTYISEPETNNFVRRMWESDYPVMDSASGYSLSLDLTSSRLDDPFEPGFNEGYEDIIKPERIPAVPIFPENNVRISSIEICNGSGYGIRRETYLPLITEIPQKGSRLTRYVNPIQLITKDIGIYPSGTSVWQSSKDGFDRQFDTSDPLNASLILSYLQSDDPFDYIKLISSSPVQDSGRLTLKFDNIPTKEILSPTDGAFAIAFLIDEFDSAQIKAVRGEELFFIIDEISLRVLARKAQGAKDYSIDVVGFTDDGILNRTPKIGGYLQNADAFGVGSVPKVSGFKEIDDLGISSETVSDRDQYYLEDITPNPAKDHYVLSTLPIINSTRFQEYIIPLNIHKDQDKLGLPIDYRISSYLENLFVDLYPLPSGAEISNIQLAITYKPANGLNLYTFAQGDTRLTRRTVHIVPSTMSAQDKPFNLYHKPLSRLENLPHAFTSPNSIKTNYAKRWHGVHGVATYGPFNASQFDFSYHNPEMEHPFTDGFYDFTSVSGNTILPSISGVSGVFTGNISSSIVKNIGWRFNNGSLFTNTLPDFSGNYKTIDWTSLKKTSNGSITDFSIDPLYGKIADTFDSAIRLSGANGYIDFGGIDTSKGFSLYIRFSPDLPVSGVNFNLMNSGIIASQWSQDNNGFIFGYEDGYLCAYAYISGQVFKAKDSAHYSTYKFPLSTLITFKELSSRPELAGTINLYTDNEIASGNWNLLRASISPHSESDKQLFSTFDPSNSNGATLNNLLIGHCLSGVGLNMFVSELGISTNIKQQDPYYIGFTNFSYDLPETIDYPENSAPPNTISVDRTDTLFGPSPYTSETFLQPYGFASDGRGSMITFGGMIYVGEILLLKNFENPRNNGIYIVEDIPADDRVDNSYSVRLVRFAPYGTGKTIPNGSIVLVSQNSEVYYLNSDKCCNSIVGVDDLYFATSASYSTITRTKTPWFRDSVYKLSDITQFFESSRTKYVSSNDPIQNTDGLHKLLDEDSELWHVGDFKICQFSPDFDYLTKRIGNDYITHKIKSDGIAYSQITNLPLPSNVYASGLSYHTQIENDFLRFYLEDLPDNNYFHSAHQRISKNLPRKYNFEEDAIIVDSIIEYETQNDILWPDGKVGPKLIVSMYAPSQDPDYAPSKRNWGLVNRAIHYLEPSGCWQKIKSGFTKEFLFDESEPWAMFDIERNVTEVEPKYYTDDVNKMYLQYDLVYPSGPAYEATFKLHTAHVRLAKAITKAVKLNKGLNLVGSGEKKSLADLNLYSYGSVIFNSPSGTVEYLPLGVSGREQIYSSGIMSLTCSGVFLNNSKINLFTRNVGSINSGPVVFGANFGAGPLVGMNLYVNGRNNKFDEQSAPMFVNTVSSSDSGNLSLFVKTDVGRFDVDHSLNLYVRAAPLSIKYIHAASMPIFINQGATDEIFASSMNLFVSSKDFSKTKTRDYLNLVLVNYPGSAVGEGKTVINWNGDESGEEIEVDDNGYAYLESNDEIRGVSLICHGNCTVGTCERQSMILHETLWTSPSNCINGGIFRPEKTYTNLQTSGFKTDIGYSGHFYGIRKYTGLLPSSPYYIYVDGQTGNGATITLPTEYMESEYGTDLSVNYTNRRLSAETPFADGTSHSKQVNEKFGKSVAIKGNLACVGAPGSTLSIDGQNFDNAGAVYVFRREDRPVGATWPEGKQKSPWYLEEKLLLPSGFRRDYFDRIELYRIPTNRGFFNLPYGLKIIQKNWHVGQEGREFGHSVALASTNQHQSFGENKREVIVVGGPKAKWSRTFADQEPSGVQLGLILITDEFQEKYPYFDSDGRLAGYWDYNTVKSVISDKDLLFRYFSQPPVKFDVKVVLCEATRSDTNFQVQDFSEPKPDFIFKREIERHRGPQTLEQNERIFSGIKEAFHAAFPYDTTKLNNNIPPMLGFIIDNSASMRNAMGDAVAMFRQYYREYSYASGLRDFFGVRSSGVFKEYDPSFISADDRETAQENWVFMSEAILSQILDTGNMLRNNEVRFLTSGIEQSNNIQQFNIPPESGGRVYVFEKESGSWNLIQEIRSPVRNYYSTPDRFGHSVAISDNSEIISVGSPYISECCKIYEYRPQEKERLYEGLYDWLIHKSAITAALRYSNLISEYEATRDRFGRIPAQQNLYSTLNSTEKFEARQFLNITEYANIFTYTYGNIGMNGKTWRYIPERFAPSSRLGYSTAVNEDGSIVAFGAPTDSFNEWEDGAVWYKNAGYIDPENYGNLNGPIISSWANNTNAGAVRLFESRKYYPHNSAVEYGVFGNLQQASNFPEDSGRFSYLQTVFADKNFRKMGFTEVDIPQDAGLLFIITPKEDALSDEIADKLLTWLALGDRNLVLVGNDPIWEKSGLYAKSNNIINKILSRLKSRLKIMPANSEYEACVTGDSYGLPSFIPANFTSSYVVPTTKRAYGVGDIKIVFEENPTLYQTMQCFSKSTKLPEELLGTDEPEYEILNDKCELPLRHLGDLRAEWISKCRTCDDKELLFKVNWAHFFGTYVPRCCENVGADPKETIGQEPVPLMAAGKYLDKTTIIPEVPPTSGTRIIYEIVQKRTGQLVFDDSPEKVPTEPTIFWTASGNNYTLLTRNASNIVSQGMLYEPEVFDDRASVLMANGIPQSEVIESTQVVSPHGYYCAVETYEKDIKRSQIIVVAGVETESLSVLKSQISDRNINFYANLVQKINRLPTDRPTDIRIAQLAGWTKRSSFKEGYEQSYLFDLFSNLTYDITENVVSLSSLHDVCWIANPDGLPNNTELEKLLQWLDRGDKKLIITYDPDHATLFRQLSDMIGSKIKPLFLSVSNEYAKVSAADLSFNLDHPVSAGDGTFATSIETFYIAGQYEPKQAFVPLKIVDGVVPICWEDKKILDKKLTTQGYWNINPGVTKVSFPALPGSGYKIFITTVAETPSETEGLFVAVQNVTQTIQTESELPSLFGFNYGNDYLVSEIGELYQIDPKRMSLNSPSTRSFNAQALADKNEINFYIGAPETRATITTSQFIPKTVRILGVSGVLIPIRKVFTVEEEEVPVGIEHYLISSGTPETTVTERILSPILNDNTRYCPDERDCARILGRKPIADGPVIVAQEPEHFSKFLTGVARSRITVISDSSLVQGKYMSDSDSSMSISAETVSFLRSLYPETVWPRNDAGREFNVQTKMLSPERGSPQKYLALSANSGISLMFGNSSGDYQTNLATFSDKESKYDPRFVRPAKEPWKDDATREEIERAIEAAKGVFNSLQYSYGATARFSGIYNGKWYEDAGAGGGLPQILIDTDHDYLDFDFFPSGFPGDLFGYSVALYQDKLLVGSPFSAFSQEDAVSWNYIVNGGRNSGIQLSHNGGAGAVYVFERNGKGIGLRGSRTPWAFTQKLRPNSLNVGSNSGLSIIGDRFGNSVSIDADIIAIGAPGHDYSNLEINGSGNLNGSGLFMRRSFNPEFNIPSRTVYDLGNSSNRAIYDPSNSVPSGHNTGAIYTYENKIVDWPNKKQKWVLVEKLTEDAPSVTVSSMDMFGESVAIDRSRRTDADYTIIGSSKNDSDTNASGIGSSFVTDIMLREQAPAMQSPDAYIDARIFGDTDASGEPSVRIMFRNNLDINKRYYNQGVVFTNNDGEIFIEASGQDPVAKGFTEHRPYIRSVQGEYFYGIPNSGILSLYVDSTKNQNSKMNLFYSVDETANVYNELGLYTWATYGDVSNGPSGLLLYTHSQIPIPVSESGLSLFMEKPIGSYSDNFTLTVRGF